MNLIAGCCQKSWQHHLPPLIRNHMFSMALVLVQSRDVLDKIAGWRETSFLILGLAFWHFGEGLGLPSWMHGLQGLREAAKGTEQGQEEDSRGRPSGADSKVAQWVPAVEWCFPHHYRQPATLSWSLSPATVPPGDSPNLLFQETSRRAALIYQMGCHFP